MKLKEYQERALKEVKGFLEQLVVWRPEALRRGQWLFDFAEKAWEEAGVGLVSYEGDILSRVRWQEADVTPLYDLELSLEEKRDVELRAGLGEDLRGMVKEAKGKYNGDPGLKLDYAYAAGHLLDVVPNPWIGYEFVERVFTRLLAKWKGKEKVVANNLVFILEEIRKRLEAERDRLAEDAFNKMLDDDVMRFMVIARDLGVNRLPKKVEVPKSVVKASRVRLVTFHVGTRPSTTAGLWAVSLDTAVLIVFYWKKGRGRRLLPAFPVLLPGSVLNRTRKELSPSVRVIWILL